MRKKQEWKKKLFGAVCVGILTAAVSVGTQAREMNLCVNDQMLWRDVQNVQGFDMLPILDIAGELGFQSHYDGSQIQLYNDWQTFVFKIGDASVYDLAGNWYGLDVVPQVMGGKVMVPAKFFQDVFGMSYVWDSVTDSLFLNSENSYNNLLVSPEHQRSNPDFMKKWYASSLTEAGYIASESGEIAGSNYARFDIEELWYYVDDFNEDGVLDLAVAPGEEYGIQNGLMIYSVQNGKIKRVFNTGFPYSAGSETATLAKRNGRYGMFWHRWHSSDTYSFGHFYGDWSYGMDISGWHMDDYGEWEMNGSNIGKTRWYQYYNSIKPVEFYNIWTLRGF